MNAREAQNILQQEVARRTAVEHLVKALEVAAQSEEIASSAKKRVGEWTAKEAEVKAEATALLESVAEARKLAAAAEVEQATRVKTAKADADTLIAKVTLELQTKLSLAQENYNARQDSLAEMEEHSKAVFEENKVALDAKLKELRDQVEAEELRLEVVRKLRADLQKV